MSKQEKKRKSRHVERLGTLMAESARLRRLQTNDQGLTPGQHLLSEWQARRLARTYADLADQSRYNLAVEFFLSDLYGARDFSQRDTDIERVFPLMTKVLSDPAIQSLTTAVELHTVTQSLDARLLDVLVNELDVDVTAGVDALHADTYAQAYRICDNRDERLHQLELAQQAGQILDEVVKKSLIYSTVRLARKPAHLAGFGELQDFIERGLRAFRRMRGADHFLSTIRYRETYILDRIFAGDPASTWAYKIPPAAG